MWRLPYIDPGEDVIMLPSTRENEQEEEEEMEEDGTEQNSASHS